MDNVTFTAVLAAILAVTQGATVLFRNWLDELNISFALLCATVFVINVGLAMGTIQPDVRLWDVLNLLGSIASAPAAVYFFLRLLGKPQRRGASLEPLMIPLGSALSVLVIVAFQRPREVVGVALSSGHLLEELSSRIAAQPATYGIALLTGSYIFTCFGFIFLNVLERRKRSSSRLERARLTWLIWLGAVALVGNMAQAARPYLVIPGSHFPIGQLTQLAMIAFLSQVILLYRLLDLHEILGRGLIFIAQVLIIGGVYSFLLMLFGDARNYVNLAITVFLASGVVSLLHDPARGLIRHLIQRLFVKRRFELMVKLTALDEALPRILSVEALFDALLEGLGEVPRITHAAIFLWDEKNKHYSCHRRSGPEGWPPPEAISVSSPFAEELVARAKPFGHEDLLWEIDSGRGPRPEVPAALSTLRKLDAEVAVPFTRDGLLFGFLLLKDDSMHEGFTYDELELLQQLADKASVILQNTDAIQRMKERDRLAALGQMAAGLAHEIRNPLGAIRGAAQYLADDEGEEIDREFLDVIVEEVDRLATVVTEFLDYSRPLKPQLEPWDMNRLIHQTMALMQAQGLPENVEVELKLESDASMVSIDVEKMKQVLLNLLQNAMQAMPEGGTLTVETRPAPKRPWAGTRRGDATLEHLEVRIWDTGQGISPENMRKLFIPFYTTKPNGTGLGLAISERLVQAQNGELEVESPPEGGSCFTIRLPLQPIADENLPEVAEAS